MAKGGCDCKKIEFEFEGDAPEMIYCHCAICRKLSGHYVAASSGIGEIDIRGEPKWYESSPGYLRGFCPDCGAPLFWRDIEKDHLSIMAGAFEEGTKLSAKKHIFVDEKSEYYPICDGLPQHKSGET